MEVERFQWASSILFAQESRRLRGYLEVVRARKSRYNDTRRQFGARPPILARKTGLLRSVKTVTASRLRGVGGRLLARERPEYLETTSQRCLVMNPEEWLASVFGLIAASMPVRFSGLGLVLYTPPLNLPVTPLVPPSQMPELPGSDIGRSAELLRRLSDIASPLHDGFHLVNAQSLAITHLCHFFAPSIPASIPKAIPDHPVGARFMAALLGSLLPSVVMTAILNDREGAIVIERGEVRTLTLPRA